MQYHAAALLSQRKLFDGAVDGLMNRALAGQELIMMKQEAGHGQWLRFMRENCHLTERTLQRYMTLARNWEEISRRLADAKRNYLESNPTMLSEMDERDLVYAVVRAVVCPQKPTAQIENANAELVECGRIISWASRLPDWLSDPSRIETSLSRWSVEEKRAAANVLKPLVRLYELCAAPLALPTPP